jgi:hypothetical protein
MNTYNIESREKITRIKAILVTFIIHFGLLYGLLYMNNNKAEDLIPSFVKEWVKTDASEDAIVNNKHLP